MATTPFNTALRPEINIAYIITYHCLTKDLTLSDCVVFWISCIIDCTLASCRHSPLCLRSRLVELLLPTNMTGSSSRTIDWSSPINGIPALNLNVNNIWSRFIIKYLVNGLILIVYLSTSTMAINIDSLQHFIILSILMILILINFSLLFCSDI